MGKLWLACHHMPFTSQSSVITLRKNAIRTAIARGTGRSKWRWSCIQNSKCIRTNRGTNTSNCTTVRPELMIGFICEPGEGCEPLNLFVAQYPTSQHLTAASPWNGSAFCKIAGVGKHDAARTARFDRHHRLVTAALGAARDLGFSVTIDDESEHWNKQPMPKPLSYRGSRGSHDTDMRMQSGLHTPASPQELNRRAELIMQALATAIRRYGR